MMHSGKPISKWFSVLTACSGLDTNLPLVSQIDSWLAHLPSDMESYIRPGCLVLTIFVSMPVCGWAEVHFLAETASSS